MSEVRTISKVVQIHAPEKKVWQTLFDDATYRQWASCFSEWSYAQTDWQEGSQAIFTDGSGGGLVGRILTSRAPNFLEIQIEGELLQGQPSYDSPMAEAMKGYIENYTLTEQDGVTTLSINSDMGEDYYEDMSSAWDRALVKLKELAEG
jgi:uncharacterized protein YndB with AHSA1/START domain